MSKKPLDLQAVREALASKQGQSYWRSLEQLADTESFQALVDREFPRHASEMRDPLTRRNFLKLMGASLAMAGLSGCSIRQPQEKIVPYVRLPEAIIPGKPLFFASAHVFQGYAQGVLVESHEGRPTKIEGNGEHPATLGRSDVFMQASVLQMYDPDRSQRISNAGAESDWAAFSGALGTALANAGTGAAGVRLLTGTVTSPTLASQIQQFLTANPQARWYQFEPGGGENTRNGAQLAFGQNVNTTYDFTQANVVLSLDSDFFAYGPANVRYQYDFMSRRKIRSANGADATMNRLYAVEPMLTITGSNADHRLPIKAAQVGDVARAIAAAVGVAGVTAGTLPENATRFAQAVATDLQANRGAGVVIAGEGQPAEVHALAHAINAALGNAGTTVLYTEPVEALPTNPGTIADLVADIDGGAVQALVMMDVNPVYSAPGDLTFGDKLASVPFSVHYGLYIDETAERSTWHVPSTHYLEHWSDARAFDGTATIIQPLIAPLYGNKSPHEFVAALLGQNDAVGYDIIRTFYQGQGGTDFTSFWEQSLNVGVVANTQAAQVTPTLAGTINFGTPATVAADAFELVFKPDTKVFDGSYANNGWLQELPHTISKIAWDNVAYVSIATAERLGVSNGDVVSLQTGVGTVEAPAWVQPGVADNTIIVNLGYGRTRAGIVGNLNGRPVGFNAYAIRSSATPHFTTDVQVTKTGGTYPIASTQDHHALMAGNLEGESAKERHIVNMVTLEEYRADPNVLLHGEHEVFSLYPARQYTTYAWAMSIDLNICTGCNACVIACQSENNIAVVGKDEVMLGREMHWIRIDRYYSGGLEGSPTVVHMPMACQHCENAPCEVVCPVGATVHDAEGINNMVYNRCVGTKYCSNNCPFKVRRFNFLQYNDLLYKFDMDSIKMSRNPDVTVRSRGVMEKCTYCIQRIAEVRQDKERLGQRIEDGEVVTACQAACPTDAIVFGDLNNPASQIVQLRQLPLSYTLLDELNVHARTHYMAQVRNPNPELETA